VYREVQARQRLLKVHEHKAPHNVRLGLDAPQDFNTGATAGVGR
jgi:hypothetical protein